MKSLVDLIAEVSRWKKSSWKKSTDIHEELAKYNKPNYFVHFSPILKIGLNPSSYWDDHPNGIYTYPIKYVLETKVINLPYAGDYVYAWIVSPKRISKIAHFYRMTSEERNILSKCTHIKATKEAMEYEWPYEDVVSNYVKKVGLNWKEIKEKCLCWGRNSAKSGAFLLWEVPDKISTSTGNWNKIFREMGLDGVYDHGTSTIHSGEPIQTVFFDLTQLRIVKLIDNNYGTQDVYNTIGKE